MVTKVTPTLFQEGIRCVQSLVNQEQTVKYSPNFTGFFVRRQFGRTCWFWVCVDSDSSSRFLIRYDHGLWMMRSHVSFHLSSLTSSADSGAIPWQSGQNCETIVGVCQNTVKGWPKRWSLGCGIPRASLLRQEMASSRNLGSIFWTYLWVKQRLEISEAKFVLKFQLIT